VLGQADVVASLFDLRELMLVTVNDNVAAVSHNRKGAVTLDQAAAYLCRLSSLHWCHYRYYHEVSHIKGLVNAMADFLSRHFDLTEPELLTHFNTHFPQDSHALVFMSPSARDAIHADLHAEVSDA
jgi:hypothetical protein